MHVSNGNLLGPLALGLSLLLEACQAPPPIHLQPAAGFSTTRRRVVKAVPQPRPDPAEVAACVAPAPGLPEQRKEELFRQFAAEHPVALAQSDLPAVAGACRAAGR